MRVGCLIICFSWSGGEGRMLVLFAHFFTFTCRWWGWLTFSEQKWLIFQTVHWLLR
jgi:hypothetical protein